MDLGLSGKTALVTGSTAGIGLATASQLSAEGARVFVNGRTQQRVDEAIARIRSMHGSASLDGIAADLSNAHGCATVIASLPTVDIVVNNLSVFAPVPFDEIGDDEWSRVWETNVMSGVRLSRHYLRGMRDRNWGRLIFVSSESAVQIPAEMIHYGVTKTAEVALARGIAETLAGTNITSNSVLPGPTKSEGVGTFIAQMAEQRGKSSVDVEREFFEHARPTSLLKRFELPDEVASMIVYLCSERASGTNGAAVRVDGGVVRAIL
jgi:NAD(P)-dependent dehydrogenase (short-subunit alcohol dehydrogenase family)